MSLPVLYSFRRCPYAIRARLAILGSGLTCELREVSLANKPAEMVTASPKATVPVMVLSDGNVLEESLDIMRFALEGKDPEAWLGPMDEAAMAWIKRFDTDFKSHLDAYKYPDRFSGDSSVQRDMGLQMLKELDVVLNRQAFLAGPHFSMLDAAILPFVRQFAAVDQNWFLIQDIEHVQNWLSHFLASDLFEAAMVNFPIWTEGDAVTVFPSQA